MNEEANASVDSRGRRKWSPSAQMVYSRTIHNINDPEGALEEEINKIARRLCREKKIGNKSRCIVLRERLASKCMRFFRISGTNVNGWGAEIKGEEGIYVQVDDIFSHSLLEAMDKYETSKGLFTHYLRSKYAYRVKDEAYAAAAEDTRYGGSKLDAPISLDSNVYRNDDGSTTVGDRIEDEGTKNFNMEDDPNWKETNERETLGVRDALEEAGDLKTSGAENEYSSGYALHDEKVEDDILVETLSLISSLLGSTGRASNDTRKLYTRLFFSETLTRVTKTRTFGELEPLKRRERMLFKAVELPFQDSYTLEKCRTIPELWAVGFIEGIKPIVAAQAEADTGKITVPNYSWTLPAAIYISYLKSIGKAASNALVSQQREHYEKLLSQLMAK